LALLIEMTGVFSPKQLYLRSAFWSPLPLVEDRYDFWVKTAPWQPLGMQNDTWALTKEPNAPGEVKA
jgi:hypothetical protein